MDRAMYFRPCVAALGLAIGASGCKHAADPENDGGVPYDVAPQRDVTTPDGASGDGGSGFVPGRVAWVKTWDSMAGSVGSPDLGWGLVANARGDVAVVGSAAYSFVVDPNDPASVHDYGPSLGAFVTVFHRDGTTAFAVPLPVEVGDVIARPALGDDGSIYLAGALWNLTGSPVVRTLPSRDMSATTTIPPGHSHVFVVKLGPDGTLAWAHTADCGWQGWASGVAVNAAGQVTVVGGLLAGADFDDGPGVDSIVPDQEAETGNPIAVSYLWNFGPDGTYLGVIRHSMEDTRIDRAGDGFLVRGVTRGLYGGDDADPGPGLDIHDISGFSMTGGAVGARLLMRFDATMNYRGADEIDYGVEMQAYAVRADGELAVGGPVSDFDPTLVQYRTIDLDPSWPVDLVSLWRSFGMRIAPDGQRRWLWIDAEQTPTGLAWGADDGIYSVGNLDGTRNDILVWDGNNDGVNFVPYGGQDFWISRSTGNGNVDWIVQMGSMGGDERATASASDGARRLYVLGTYKGPGRFGFRGNYFDVTSPPNQTSAFVLAFDDDGSEPSHHPASMPPVHDAGTDVGSRCATACEDLGATCGRVPDGCGGVLSCGECPAGQSCGGSGVEYQCGQARTVLLDDLDHPESVAVDANSVYVGVWGRYRMPDGTLAHGALLRVPRAGGAVQVLASDLGEVGGVAVDADYAYFSIDSIDTTRTIGLARVPLTGGTPEILEGGPNAVMGSFGPRRICVDESAVYVAGGGGVGRVLKTGGPGGGASGGGGIGGIYTSGIFCAGGGRVYFSAGGVVGTALINDQGTQDVRTWNAGDAPWDITVRGGFAYWTTFEGLQWIETSAPTHGTPYKFSHLPQYEEHLGLAADDGTAYVAVFGPPTADTDLGELIRVPAGLQDPTVTDPPVIVSHLDHPTAVLVDGADVFVVEEGSLSRPGGRGRVVRYGR